MKKLSVLFFIVLSAFFIVSCESAEDEMILGEWKFINIEEKLSDDLIQQGRKPLTEADINSMRQSAKYVFNRNKTYTLDLIQFKDNGMWWISENGATLNMRSEKSSAVGRATIQKLSNDQLVLVIQLIPAKHIQIITMRKAS